MAKELVTDEMWEVIEPLLPEEPPKPKVAGRASMIAQPSPTSCSS
jgi:transposase